MLSRTVILDIIFCLYTFLLILQLLQKSQIYFFYRRCEQMDADDADVTQDFLAWVQEVYFVIVNC
jgi:hypothetical protein